MTVTDAVQRVLRTVVFAEDQPRDDDGKFASAGSGGGGSSDAPSSLTEKELKDGQKVAREYSKATNIYAKVEGTHDEKMAAIKAAGDAVWAKYGLPDNNALRSAPTAENMARALKGETVTTKAYVPVTKEEGQRLRQERAAQRIERGIKGGVVGRNLKASVTLASDDQARDDHGRFASEGGGGEGEAKAPLTVADVKAKALDPSELNDYTRSTLKDHNGREMPVYEVRSKDGERLGRVYQAEREYQKMAPGKNYAIGKGYTKYWKADTAANDRMKIPQYPSRPDSSEVRPKFGGINSKADAVAALVDHVNAQQSLTVQERLEMARTRHDTGKYAEETPDNQLAHGAREGAKVTRTKAEELKQKVMERAYPPEAVAAGAILEFEQERDDHGRFASSGGGGGGDDGPGDYGGGNRSEGLDKEGRDVDDPDFHDSSWDDDEAEPGADYDGPDPDDVAENFSQDFNDALDEGDHDQAQSMIDDGRGAVKALESYAEDGNFMDDRLGNFDSRLEGGFPSGGGQSQMEAASALASSLTTALDGAQDALDSAQQEDSGGPHLMHDTVEENRGER